MDLPCPDRSSALLKACESAGAKVTLHRLSVPTPTVETAAAALGVSASEIVKTLVAEAKDGAIVLAVALGTSRVDLKAVGRAAGVPGGRLVPGRGNPSPNPSGSRLRMVPAERVLAAVGYGAGAVPPVGHEPRPRAVVIDERVLSLERVYGGGGAIDAMLAIAPKDILRMAGAEGISAPIAGEAGAAS